MKFEVDASVLSKIHSIALSLRSKGVPVGTQEIETAYKIYENACALSNSNYYPLYRVLEAVFIKRIEHEVLLGYKKNSLNHKIEHVSEISSGKKRLPTRRLTESYILSAGFKEIENLSISKLEKLGIKNPIVHKKVSLARQLNFIRKYLETENPGYIDMLREEISSMRKRVGDYSRRDLSNLSFKLRMIEQAVARVAENPKDSRALLSLVELVGEDIAVAALEYSLKHAGSRVLAEAIASKVIGGSGRVKRGRGFWRKSLTGKLDLRRTLSNIARGFVGELAFKQRSSRREAIFILDRSDSMRKHASSILRVLAEYYRFIKTLIMFSDKVETMRLCRSISKAYILSKVLSLGFSGYTNVTKALRVAYKLAKPGETVIMVSDLQQTIKDEPFIKEFEKLVERKVKVIVYTTSESIRVLSEAGIPVELKLL